MRAKDTIRYILKIIFTVLITAVIIIAAVKIGSLSYEFGYRIFTETAIDDAENSREVQVQITDGMSLTSIAETLQVNGLIRDSRVFWLQVELSVYRNRLHSGTFLLNTSMTPKEMMQVMSDETNAVEETENE